MSEKAAMESDVKVVPGSVWMLGKNERQRNALERKYRYEILDGKVDRGGLVLALLSGRGAEPERVYIRHADIGTRLRRVDVPVCSEGAGSGG